MVQNKHSIGELSKQRATKREAMVIAAINSMVEDGDSISFYYVAKRTGASRSYLYNNETIRALIEKERQGNPDRFTGTKVIIDGLKREIKELKAENTKLRSLDAVGLYEEVAALKKKNKELELQLRAAYNYNDLLNPYNPQNGGKAD